MFGKKKTHEGEENTEMENETENLNEESITDEHQTDNPSSEVDELEKERQRSAELQDKFLRLSAEFENFRRRTNKEKAELIQFGNKELLLQVLPVFDDFTRAREVASKAEDKAAIIEGIELIYNKFKQMLERAGLTEIVAKGEPFDSELHDAITSIPAPTEEMKGKNIDEIQKGYKLNDKVLRHAKVVVGE